MLEKIMTSWEASKRWHSWINNNPLNLPVQIMGAIIHYMNPLHIYCRIRDMGKGIAMFLCQIYECCIFKHFLTGRLAILRKGEGRQRPSSWNLIHWLSIVVMIVVVFVPRLYGEPKHTEPVVEKSMVAKEVTISESTRIRQNDQIQPKSDATSGKRLNESTGVKMGRKRKLCYTRLSLKLQIAIRLIQPL
jgi:hypothetical protein